MPRTNNDNFARRRLAQVYDTNRRRTLAVANARDRNRRSDRDDERAPRRVVISERVTRQAGFGRGGMQARGGSRRRNNNNNRERRFEDRSVFRRGNRDRFERDDDIDRRRRRDRRDERNGNNGGRRFAVRDRRGARGNRNQPRRRNNNNNKPNKDRNLDDELDRYKKGGQGGNHNNSRGGRGGRRGGKGPVSKEDLDAQLDNFRTALTPVASSI